MNDITGFNPSELKSQIATFVEKGKAIYDALSKADWDFYDVLYRSWFSPKAKDFEPHLYDLGRVVYNLYIAYEKTASAMVEAYNAHAAANGTAAMANEYEGAEYQPDGANFGDKHLEEASPDGVVGMKTKVVIPATIALGKTIRSQLERVKESYDLPAFYDPEGNQIEAYVGTVNKMSEKIESELNNIASAIAGAIEQEEEIVERSAAQAAETLSEQ